MAQPTPSTGSSGIRHPVYAAWAPIWTKFVHIYDGSGGFLDGTYLVPHPREWRDHSSATPRDPTKKLLARRRLARYENVGGLILEQKRAALFREVPTRTIGGQKDPESKHPIEAWWDNVDGEGCHINDWMSESFRWAGLFGHVLHYMDRQRVDREAETAADTGAVFLRLYCPPDVTDWLQNDRGRLLAVKLLESVERASIDESQPESAFRERIVTEETWETRDIGTASKRGKKAPVSVERFPHEFGVLPVVVQYAKGRALAPLIGQPILGDPNLYIDLYNITSEIRELLRNQTFGQLAVKLGTGDTATSVEIAQAMIGSEKGAENVMFTPDGAEYIQPDATNVTVYQAERKELLRTIYRLAAIPWETDSLDAESEGSLKLKREDMNQVLAGYADQCEQAEYAIAKLWYRAQYGKDAWEAKWEADQVVIRYPDAFDVTPFAEILEQATASVSLPMGPTFMAEQCKRLIPKFMPDLPQQVIDVIEGEIDKAAKEAAEMERATKKAELQAIANPEPAFAGAA